MERKRGEKGEKAGLRKTNERRGFVTARKRKAKKTTGRTAGKKAGKSQQAST